MRSELQHEREQALHRLDLRMSIGEVFLYGIRNSCKMIYLINDDHDVRLQNARRR